MSSDFAEYMASGADAYDDRYEDADDDLVRSRRKHVAQFSGAPLIEQFRRPVS